MSESGKTKKLKLNPPAASSRGATPQGSRAASPAIVNSALGSRASSPEGPIRGRSPLDQRLILSEDVLTVTDRPRPSVHSSTFWQSNIPKPSGNSCRHSADWHSQQRPSSHLPSSHWRIEGKPFAIHRHRQGCERVRQRRPHAAPWSVEGDLRVQHRARILGVGTFSQRLCSQKMHVIPQWIQQLPLR